MISALPNKTFYQMSLSCWKICFQNTREAAKGGLRVWVGISGSTVCLGSGLQPGCSLTLAWGRQQSWDRRGGVTCRCRCGECSGQRPGALTRWGPGRPGLAVGVWRVQTTAKASYT